MTADLTSILDALLEGFQVIDREWRYVYVNESAARHGRTTRDALVGRTMMECYPGIDKTHVFALLRDSMENGHSHRLENAFTYPDGAVGHFELHIQPVPEGVSVLSMDITAQRQAEERLRVAQKMEAVGQLASGIAHDFNNLLTVILGQGELALERAGGPTRADVETMVAAARSSAEMTRQLLAYGRKSVLKREVLDLADVVGPLEKILRRTIETRIELRVEAPKGLGRIEADKAQIEQVIMNLVVNARDAIRGEGRITVGLSTADLDEEYVRAHTGAQVGPHVVLQVSDNGSGMDAATRTRIFEPFFTTKERGRGTGLGLSTVYGVVKQHGGNIWLYSEPGKGTTFKIYLPMTERAAAAAAAVVPAPAVSHGQADALLLVAEDDPMLRRLIEVALSPSGYRLIFATRGDEALEVWKPRHAEISLLITDVMMPGMRGPDLIQRMRVDRPDLPVICTSGYSDSELPDRGTMPAGVVFLEKPFSPKALRERVQSLLPR